MLETSVMNELRKFSFFVFTFLLSKKIQYLSLVKCFLSY